APTQAMENVRGLEREGGLSRYGFYEALDYTPERVKKGERCTLVRAYMAHHQGMSLIALDNLLNDRVMQNRFHSEPTVQATELLLQERIPRGVPAGHQSIGGKTQSYEVAFSEDKADIWRRDAGLVTHMELIVSAEDNADMRRISIANYSTRPREIELTSYAEIVLAPRADDLGHPAFSNLFIETEFHAPHSALFARRRPRSSQDVPRWALHV